MRMGRMLIGTVSVALLVGLSAMVTSAAVQDAVDNPAALADMLKDKSAQDAATIVGDVIKAAIAKGGTERELSMRLTQLAAVAIGASGNNAPAIAEAIIKATGDQQLSAVAAAIGAAAEKTGKDVKAVVDAAAKAAGEKNEKTVREACEKPGAVLGGLALRRIQRSAQIAKDKVEGRFTRRATTTTTTTTTTTLPSKDRLAAEQHTTTVTVTPPPPPVVHKPKPKPEPEKPTPTPVGKR